MKPKHFLFGLFALMAASCTNDDLNEVTEIKQNGIQVTAGLTANTRVNFEQDGSVTHALWEEDDQITLYAPSQGYLPYQVSTLSEDAASATFTPINDALQNTDETIYAAHRAGMEADIVDGMATLPNTDTWTDEHPLPFAYAISKVADGKLNLSFEHVFAYLKLTLNAETVAGSDVKEITDVYLTNPSGAPISIAAGRFDFSTQSIVEDKGVNYINYSLQESFTATGTAEKSIYIPILPQAAGETIHLAVLHKHEAGCDTLLTINKETPATGFLAGRAYTYSPKSPFFRDGNTITLTEAGTLSQAISEAEKYTITNLKIIGPLNGDDIRLIREMAGRDVNGYETEGQLTDLDISEATIVEGGGYYYRYFDGYSNYYNYFTTNYEVGIRMFHKTILKNIRIPKNTIIIDTAAFRECSSLINIVIPENVTSIGANAFTKCSSLADIIIPNTVTYLGASIFDSCSLLSEITIPDGVTYLGSYAFRGCSSLINIKLSEGLTSIGDHTFYSCDALSNIVIPDAVTTIGDYAFYGCGSLTDVVGGEGIVSIGNTAFGECKQLSTIAIPQGLISIGNGAFCNCFELKEFKIPSGVTTIEDISFYGCKSLTEMIIPDGVTSIGNGAFQYCSSLAQVAVPNSVASIGAQAFNGCAFTSFSIPESITVIAGGTFYGCKSLVDITIPNSVTEIGQSAFYACDALSDITIPNSVTEIGAKAFYSSGLKELKIPNSVTTIGMEAFCGCTSLVSVTLSDSLKVLGQSAFQKCRSLSEVISNATTPPTLGQAAFSQILATATLYIPSRAFSSYMESGWTNYFSNIISEEGFFYYNFNDGDKHLVNWGGGGGTITVENGELKITNPTLVEPYSFQMCSELSNNAFVKDSLYKLSMKIRGSVPGRISAQLQIVDGYQVAGLFPDIDFDTINQTLELTTVCDADGATRLIFNLGAYVGDIYIDDLSLIPIISDN